ncbi:lactate racemase domain-containing protein [uncultured Rubinisphaera sp.]|uniref:lactate racemase domain-containing protein n=1 Tax=uncultured Rubinisphaera sp. TaxID=1678686 RepID=UPI0030D810A5
MTSTIESKKLETMSEEAVRTWIQENVVLEDFVGKKVLMVVPDATRTAPLPLLFDELHRLLKPKTEALDVIFALGTHPPMSEAQMCKLLGIDETERQRLFFQLGLFNHEWDEDERLTQLGVLTEDDTDEISGGLMREEVPVKINKRILDYDMLFVVGPVFPHEVVGFSGGNKYFFPGISGPEVLNFFHWLGALITNASIIGVKDTPVRRVVDRAAKLIPCEKRAMTFVVAPDASLYGLSYGTPEFAWNAAADLSSQVHIKWQDKPFKQVLSCAPEMYDELWVAGKCMYKLEPVVEDGGELIIYAPHLSEISITHGDLIREIGYHVRDYFVKQPEKFSHIPRGVLAHSTHVRGGGAFEDGVEYPRVNVTLASQIPKEVCKEISLGYRDPETIDIESFANREDEGILLVRKAGEHLYRLKN